MGKIFIISGPSGVGKTTLLKRALKKKVIREKFTRVKTVTTRKPRTRGERDYTFVSREKFLTLRKKRFFAESELIYGDWYGTPLGELKKSLPRRKHLLLCIDVKGALNIKKLFKDKVCLIFIMPPSTKSLLDRIRKRGKEAKSAVRLRLERAKKEIEYSKKFDYIITNTKLEKAVTDLTRLILRILKEVQT